MRTYTIRLDERGYYVECDEWRYAFGPYKTVAEAEMITCILNAPCTEETPKFTLNSLYARRNS